jgi:hypothetical protein
MEVGKGTIGAIQLVDRQNLRRIDVLTVKIGINQPHDLVIIYVVREPVTAFR